MSKKRVAYICGDCGSPEVRWDAYASWDPARQREELASSYDETICEGDNGEECNGESIECIEVSADQDCRIEFDEEEGLLVVYNEQTFCAISQEAAEKIQTDWRYHVGRDPATGEVIEPEPSAEGLLKQAVEFLNNMPNTPLSYDRERTTYKLAAKVDRYFKGVP